MKKLTIWIMALAMLPQLFGQSLTGTWQGTLTVPNGKELRIVFKIATTDKDALKATLYSIDQPGPGVSSTPFTPQSSNVKFEVPGIGGTFEGKLSADGKSIAGTWTQGGPLPLNLTRADAETAWAIPEPPPRLKPMAADANPSFEVCTIKPSKPETQGRGFRMNGRNFSTINTSLADLMTFAYGVQKKQILGVPEWAESEKYDLGGKPDGDGMPSDRQLKGMMQKLLADRFKLKFHHDKKELSVYALTVSKTGSKLTKSEADPNGLPGLFFRGLGKFVVRNATMADFAGTMQTTALDRPIVDQTGLVGRFDFTLNWTPDEFQFTDLGPRRPPPASDDAAKDPDLFTAIQQQLGLKLEATKAPADVLVIDHVEKPSEN
jgi:uncharacterized protein (TIGR03435 family)